MSKQCACDDCDSLVELVKSEDEVETKYHYRGTKERHLMVAVKPLIPNSLGLCWYHRRIFLWLNKDIHGITPFFQSTIAVVKQAVRNKL